MKLTKEMLTLLQTADSANTILHYADENGITITKEQADSLFQAYHNKKEINEDELASVSGGCSNDDDTVEEVKEFKFCSVCNNPHWMKKVGPYEYLCPFCNTITLDMTEPKKPVQTQKVEFSEE